MASEAVKLEREKRKTAREAAVWNALNRPEVVAPVVGILGAVALQKLGETRLINRDFAGFLLAAWVAYTAAEAGIHDKWALAALTGAATAAYSVSTPTREGETVLELQPAKVLGGDGKLFWWDLPLIGSQG